MRDQKGTRNAEIGATIRQVRQSKKMSLVQVAETLGKTVRTLQKYELGEIDLTVSSLEQIAAVLDVRPWELLGYQVGENLPNTFEIWTTGFAEGFKGGVAFAENRKDGNCS